MFSPYDQLADQVEALTQEIEFSYQRTDYQHVSQALGKAGPLFDQLRRSVWKEGFPDLSREIHFFKHTKPRALAQLFYLHGILQFWDGYSLEGDALSYILQKSLSLEMTHAQDPKLFQYMQLGQSHYDSLWFTREGFDVGLAVLSDQLIEDPRTKSLKDYLWALYLAMAPLREYYSNVMTALHKEAEKKIREEVGNELAQEEEEEAFFGKLHDFQLEWADSKASLVMLIYALHLNKCVKAPRYEISSLVKAFEALFNIDLKNAYGIFYQLKNQSRPGQFLSQLLDAFLKGLEEDEE